jgi:hypothetical protein
MANYKNIKGFNIQYLDSDPPNPIEGQMWFNSTTQTLKGAEAATIVDATWASGVALNTARSSTFAFGTTISTTTAVGGYSDDIGSVSALTEQYNGSSWTEVGDINTARATESRTGSGTQTAGLIYSGGSVSAITEAYNGTSWSEQNDLNTTRRASGGAGVQTAALNIGGRNPAIADYANVESYNGTSWTETTDINTARYGLAGIGTSTSALAISGYISPITSYTTASESWNGTSWTTITSLSNPRYQGCGNANGASSTSALVFANIHPGSSSGATEYWNGSSWTELNDMANLIASRSGSGSAISAMGIGGGPPTTGATEEWNVPDVLIKTFTTS